MSDLTASTQHVDVLISFKLVLDILLNYTSIAFSVTVLERNFWSSLDYQTASTVRISYVLRGLEGSSGDATQLRSRRRI